MVKSFACNICNSNDFMELFPSGKAQIYRIVKCNTFNLIYANPQIDNVGDVEKLHLKSGQDSAIEEKPAEKFNPETNQYLKRQFLQLKDYARIIDFVESDLIGIFLEVGFNEGVFLDEARKRGWKVLGIERLEIPADYCENELGIRIIRKYFKNAEIEPESIGVIVSCHVIEHARDPTLFIR